MPFLEIARSIVQLGRRCLILKELMLADVDYVAPLVANSSRLKVFRRDKCFDVKLSMIQKVSGKL